MILPLLAVASAIAAFANHRRIRVGVERAYAARFTFGDDAIAQGAQSFTLEGTNGCGVLLLHGSGDSPQTLRYLASRLNERGYTVHAPLLPGHGRSPRAFAQATADDYLTCARAALDSLRQTCGRLAVVGLSMGGAIGARLAADERDIRALALLAPYLVPPTAIRRIAASGRLWGVFSPYLQGRGKDSVFDATASRESRAYGTFSPGALRALVDTAAAALAALPQLHLPMLVVNSAQDNRIPRECAEQALRAFRTSPEVHWVSGCGHVITIDYCKEAVADHVIRFLDAHT